jgi:hypothetical protein
MILFEAITKDTKVQWVPLFFIDKDNPMTSPCIEFCPEFKSLTI